MYRPVDGKHSSHHRDRAETAALHGKRHFRVAGGLADPDLTVTARAAVEPLRDAPDQPGLIALGGDAEQGLAGVGRVAEHAKAPLSRLETRGRRPCGISHPTTGALR
jgi:hypothetical protein